MPNDAAAHDASRRADPSVWVADLKPNLRRVTVLIRALPPATLVDRYQRLAARFQRLEPLFKSAAMGGFGSGFAVVRREPPAVFLVTNRHVVGLSSEIQVTLEGESAARPARVVYVDDRYDLVVLAFGASASPASPATNLPVTAGLAMAPDPARDQDAVVASGYPGIGDRPSYQVTRGFVSNERFVLDEASAEIYVQHSAPIDPGSSGGPLTTPDGKLLGVNTLKIRGRENVGLAVPASVVASALERVISNAKSPPRAPEEQALTACETLLADATAGPNGIPAVERALGASVVADLGVASLAWLPPPDEKWIADFIEDPTSVFVHAVALRLARGSNEGQPRCSRISSDAASVSFKAQLAGAERVLSFAFEQGRWKLTKADLGRSSGHSFLDGAGPTPAQKKWKPSLR